jgi:hypothetical protein
MQTAIAARPAPTATLQRENLPRIESLISWLTVLAEARGADVSTEAFELYATALAEFPAEDVRAALDKAARRKLAEFEKPWPRLGDLVEPLEKLQDRRRADERAARERQEAINRFWDWVPEHSQRTGLAEREILDRFPSFKGSKRGE